MTEFLDISQYTPTTIGNILCQDQALKLAIHANMKKFGGSFVQALGECILRADSQNLVTIAEAFPHYLIEYRPQAWKQK